MAVTVAAGLIRPALEALSSIEGRKPVTLAVRLARVAVSLEEYQKVWADDSLAPAIRAFTAGGDAVPDSDLPAFMAEHGALFDEEVGLDITPLALDELTVEGLTIDVGPIALLLHTGIVVD